MIMKYQRYHQADLSKYTFLVTGGAGFIGSHLVDYLVQHGAGKVVVLDDLAAGTLDNLTEALGHENVQFIEGNIADKEVCIAACEGVDYVLHQAALGSVPRSIVTPTNTHAANATGFINMLDAVRSSNVKRLVYASSSSVYGDSKLFPKAEEHIGQPLSPYAVSKRTNELYAEVFASVYGTQLIGLRYFNIFGPRQNPEGPYAAAIPIFIRALMEGKSPRINGDGEQTRDFTFVANAVQANIKALFASEEALGKVYNIACGKSISINQVFSRLQGLMNSKVLADYGPERTGDVRDSLASIERAQNLLGYIPEVGFDEGIASTVAWYTREQEPKKQ
jgi:UDP-N-acetylglucosamine 4-epimerase